MQNQQDEIWKPIPGYPKYEASTLGQIRSVYRELVVSDHKYNRVYKTRRESKVIKQSYNFRGYLRIDMRSTDRKSGMTEASHRLIAKTFIPNPNSYPQVNHINGIKDDNRVENLEWCTNLQNNRHARIMGSYPDLSKPENFISNKLDVIQVLTIRKCLSYGMRYKPLADYFKVSKSSIKAIKLRRTWSAL